MFLCENTNVKDFVEKVIVLRILVTRIPFSVFLGIEWKMSSFVGGADIVVGPGGVTTAGGADGESGMTTYTL